MLIYTLFLIVPLWAAAIQPLRRRRHWPGLTTFFLLLLAFCGLRYQIGPDWWGYDAYYEMYVNTRLDEIFDLREPGFFLINKLSEASGTGLQGVIFASSAIFLAGCFAYAKRTVNPWYAIAAVTPYLIFVISMSGIRQASAIGIGYLMLARWNRSSSVEKLALIAAAVAFHNSALIFLLFLVLTMQRSIVLRLALGAATIALSAQTLLSTEAATYYKASYVEENLISGGAIYHVLLVAIPSALYLLSYRRLSNLGLTDSNVTLASVMTLALMPFLAVSSTGVDRLTLYFSFVQMWAYPALIQSRVINPSNAKFALTAFTLTVFVVYFFFGTHADAYIPYRSVLTS